MKLRIRNRIAPLIVVFALAACAAAQGVTRELKLGDGGTLTIVNPTGRVSVEAKPDVTTLRLDAASTGGVIDSELEVESGGSIRVATRPGTPEKRIDLTLTVPERIRLKIETREGEVRVAGDLASVEVKTETGTIAADVPLTNVRYDFLWTASRPRYLSDVELKKVKEKSGGKFQLKGRYIDAESDGRGDAKSAEKPEEVDVDGSATNGEKNESDEKPRSTEVSLRFQTARGIVLLNVPPNEVSSDLRERPLTNAAKAIVRSGDLVLMDAIRRASPKYFGEYSRTLPPAKREPYLAEHASFRDVPGESVKDAVIRVTDMSNRSIAGLTASDLMVAEAGTLRDIVSVTPHTAPVNLVLLLDVSGSVDNYQNFIRKAARAFLETARPEDRISLILFNDDIKVLSGFSTDRRQLSESLDTFDAGGATAYYDAVAYTLAETLRPLRGERTAIVVLTDGDDNRSFLPFDSLIGAIEESGALIYPLYVPSALIAAGESHDPEKALDPLRTRYLTTLSARAQGEGERLAKVSGGVYYPITQLSQIQKAYDDIVSQIRTAYTVRFRSGYQPDPQNRPSPRLKIRANRPNTFVQISSVTAVGK